jgi:twinkle protein
MGKGICVEKIGSIQIFQQEDGSYDGYDYAKGVWISDPYKDKPKGYRPVRVRKSPEEIAAEIEEIKTCPIVALPDRMLKKYALEYFGVRIGLSEVDGETPKLHYYPYHNDSGELLGFKARVIENKRMWSVGDTKGACFFGWEQAKASGAKTLYITEGELDAVALYQILKDKAKGGAWEDHNPAVVSLPSGIAHATEVLSRNSKQIYQIFKEVVLVFDNDKAGQDGLKKALQVMPEALSVNLPCKDVNDCLLEGKEKAALSAIVFRKAKPTNSRIVEASTLHEAARKPAEWGLEFPWKGLTDVTRGARFGETYYIGAAPKMGKSELVNELGSHFIKKYGLKVFMAKPEEANLKTYKMVAGKMVGKKFHDPKVEFDEKAYDKAGELIGQQLLLLDLYQHLGWESLKADIRNVAAQGVKVVFIDPITNLTNGMDAATANVHLQEIAQELSAMAKDLDIIVFVFCHLRNPDAGPAHDRGGKVLSAQFAGSRAMARSCNYMFGLEGNKDDSSTKEERNLRDLVLLEDREFGETARIPLYWDEHTTLFNELQTARS